MTRMVVVVALVLVVAAGGWVWWFKLEPGPPLVEITGADVVGRQAAWDVVVRAQGHPPLRRVEVVLRAGGQALPLLSEELSKDAEPTTERRVRVAADLAAANVPQGPAQVEVVADSHAWNLFGDARGTRVIKDITVDTVAPQVELLTTQHNVRLGGVELVVFRAGDAVDSSVAVGPYAFAAVRGYFADPAVALALFAVPQDLSTDAQPVVRALDAAGNATEVALPVLIKGRQFPERQLDISDAFLERKVPEILTAVKKPVPADLAQGYLTVNREVRRESEDRLRAVTASSAERPLWSGPFHRQSNAAPMSAFADRRSYIHKGETIDRQTHLGYDLASLKRAPVEAAQNGVVVFADYLGIYGNTVVIDHGLGVFSLYGHLSTLAAQTGQQVTAGQTIGQTGETGLAGGDHLHFSIMLRGTHVDPVEWWDPLWMRDHVSAKLNSLPAANPPAAAAPAEGGAGAADGQAHP